LRHLAMVPPLAATAERKVGFAVAEERRSDQPEAENSEQKTSNDTDQAYRLSCCLPFINRWTSKRSRDFRNESKQRTAVCPKRPRQVYPIPGGVLRNLLRTSTPPMNWKETICMPVFRRTMGSALSRSPEGDRTVPARR